jgi:serine/threonine-protein kinase
MAVAPQAGDAVGAVLNGQWKLNRLIGEGGLAAVYEAESTQGKGRRAVKLLHAHFRSQQNIIDRFYAEAKACFSLRHPHIATVEAYAYAEDGSPYMVMELLEGMSLEQFLQRGQPMPIEQASPILFAILQALSVAHARGIVHRDLKPANLFLVPDEKGEFAVKVLDFGIAKVMDVAGGMGGKTRTGAVLGTPGYMSPEQVKNAKAVDPRTDLWAAGVVFYEMVSGHHPWGKSDQLARMIKVLTDPHVPLSTVAPQLAAWEGFVSQAIARDPEQRFQSADQMAAALRQIAQGTPAKFVPDGLQTVAIPMMADQIGQPAHGGSVHSAPIHSVAAHSAPIPMQSHAPPAGAQPVGSTQASVGLGPIVQPRAGSSTHISEERPHGTPTIQSDAPQVNIIDAREPEPPSLVWWGVVLVGCGTFVLGLLVGYLLFAG